MFDAAFLFLAFAALPVVIWLYLLLGRGRFWRVDCQFAPAIASIRSAAYVAVVIPARNEADVIGRTIGSLLRQNFSGPLHIFLVDDASTDGTADQALKAAAELGRADSLTVVTSSPLPGGWTGKMWAVSQGVARAIATRPDYLLLTDADIDHSSDNVQRLTALAESGSYDLTSLMVKLQTVSFAEKALIPAFIFFFFMLYPPAWISSSGRKLAGAAGGCILVRPETLLKAGGIEAIRSEIIDDCALATIIKRVGGRVWLGLTAETASTRSYGSFGEIGRMVSRTAFNQLHHSTLLLMGTVIGLLLTYVLPVALVFSGTLVSALAGVTAWALMTTAFFPMVRFYRLNPLWSLALPVVASFYMGATVHSAVKYWLGKGGEWKGRAQDS
jgi:hopene-associated glycosyltransferase HpnB